jgi:hypothetical protein
MTQWSLSTALRIACAFVASGCSVLLSDGEQCSSDSDCRLSNTTCVRGICVHPDAGTTSADGGITDDTVAWVLGYSTHHQDLRADSLYLAYSMDGQHFQPLSEGRPVFSFEGIGSGHLRDPSLFRKNDGTFVLVASDFTLAADDENYWNNPSPRVLVADSTNLIEFTNPRLLTVTTLEGPGGTDMHAWAPEAFFDSVSGEYGVLFSGNDSTDTNRVYVTFVDEAFGSARASESAVLFDPGYSIMQATLVNAGTARYLFFRDATTAGSDVQVARSPSGSIAPGSFDRWSSEYVTSGDMQSPLCLRSGGSWYLYAERDATTEGSTRRMRGWRSDDLDADPASWEPVASGQLSFPHDAIHGSAIRVRQSELDALLAHYGATYPGHRVRTTHLGVGGLVEYVLHNHHVTLAPLGVEEQGIAADDYTWRLAPGLADPTDPNLISFESATRPGFYWRVRSESFEDWPDETGPFYRDEDFAAGSTTRHNHLVFMDRIQADDSSFANDATFRRVPATNGDDTMSSFQWYVDPTLHVGYFEGHLVAQDRTVHGGDDITSFTLEQVE